MSLEVSYKKRATPRVRARRAKAKLVQRPKTARFFRGEPLAAEAVLDISSTGMKLLARGKPFEKGDALAIEITHPTLATPVALEGVVRWVKAQGKSDAFTAGVEFESLGVRAREALEHVVTLELGSMVHGARGHVGWVGAASADSGLGGLLFVYDLTRTEIATIVDEKDYLQATRVRGDEVAQRQATSVEALLRWIFELKEGEVSIDPPL